MTAEKYNLADPPFKVFHMVTRRILGNYYKKIEKQKKVVSGIVYHCMDAGDSKVCLFCAFRNSCPEVENKSDEMFRRIMAQTRNPDHKPFPGTDIEAVKEIYTCENWQLSPDYNIKHIRQKLTPRKTTKAEFYVSQEWRHLRATVLEQQGGACQCCGRTHREHGVILHVDHIVPISKDWGRRLDPSNLQILCEDCNMGKGNRYTTDWRTARQTA